MANPRVRLYTAGLSRSPEFQVGLMRIAFITTMATAPWGGSEALWGETARRALDAGHEVFISVYDWPTTPAVVQQLVSRGARLHRRKASRRWRRSGILTRLFYPFRELHEFRPDAVLINQGSTYDISRSGEFTRLRRVLTETDRWPFMLLCHCEQAAPRHARARARARAAFSAARIVGLLSHSLRRRSEQHLETSLPNTRLFQNPLNIGAAQILPWPEDTALRLAFVGRLDEVKGLHLAIEALSASMWRDRDWLLDVFGEGDLRSELERQAEHAGLRDRVRFRGFTSDVDDIWRQHHLLILPSRAEGVPNSMLEAMLRGRPVLVSDVGGIGEWVSDGATGYVLSRPDIADLAAALDRVWAERDRLEQMGRMAYESTLARRDPDPAATLLAWLEEIGSNAAIESRSARVAGSAVATRAHA